jgi:hypothetical protein
MDKKKYTGVRPIEGHFYRFEAGDGVEHIGLYEGQMTEPSFALAPLFTIDRMVFSFMVYRAPETFSMIGYPFMPRLLEDLGESISDAEFGQLQAI